LSLADAIFLEASVSEVSKKIVSAIGKQEKELLCRQFTAIQRKVSALQIGVSNPAAYYPANNSTARKLDNNDQREADDFAKLIWRQGEEIGHWVMEKASEDPPRKMVSKLCMPFHPFHRQLPMQLDPTHHDHHSLLPPPLFGSSQQPEVSLTSTKKSRNG